MKMPLREIQQKHELQYNNYIIRGGQMDYTKMLKKINSIEWLQSSFSISAHTHTLLQMHEEHALKGDINVSI